MDGHLRLMLFGLFMALTAAPWRVAEDAGNWNWLTAFLAGASLAMAIFGWKQKND